MSRVGGVYSISKCLVGDSVGDSLDESEQICRRISTRRLQ